MKATLALITLVAASAANAGTPSYSPPSQASSSAIESKDAISYSNISFSWLGQWGDGPLLVTGIPVIGSAIAPAAADYEAHGIVLGLEYSPVEHLYLAFGGSWSEVTASWDTFNFMGGVVPGGSATSDYYTLNAGIGGYIPISENIHFVTEVGANYAEWGGVIDDWGLYVTPHVRAKFGMFETHLGVTYNSSDAVPAEWTGFVRLLFELAPVVDVFVGGSIAFDDRNGFEDVYGLTLGLRVKF